MDQLTPIQGQVLEALRRRADRGEPPPTYRDLCDEFGWSSTGTARDHLQALARKGYLDLAGRRARLLRLHDEVTPVVRVPLLGRVVAGSPVPAEEDVEGRVPVPADWIGSGSYFALRVCGDSMTGAGVFDGDVVVLRAQFSAQDGEVVAATIEGETTLKMFRRKGTRAVLAPANPHYRDIEIGAADLVIHGIVVGLLRRYPLLRAERTRAEERGLRAARRTTQFLEQERDS